MATFILVHGSFGGGWYWHLVAPQKYKPKPNLNPLASHRRLTSPFRENSMVGRFYRVDQPGWSRNMELSMRKATLTNATFATQRALG